LIEDDGPGVSQPNSERVFQTTARAEGGTGLGLTVVASLLAAHGASIRLVPSQRGATFEIVLPVAD
jgi:signal transduction histidine kinase